MPASAPNSNNANFKPSLHSSFVIQNDPKNFFVPGKLLKIPWSQPAGEVIGRGNRQVSKTASGATSEKTPNGAISSGIHDAQFWSGIKRFVVIRTSDHYCNAIPITSNSGRGTNKKTISLGECAAIYSGDAPPNNRKGKTGLLQKPIRTVVDDPDDRLWDTSILCFGKVCTIEYNVKVRSLGNVHIDSMPALSEQYLHVWAGVLAASDKIVAETPQSHKVSLHSDGSLSTHSTALHPLAPIHKIISGTPGAVEECDESRLHHI